MIFLDLFECFAFFSKIENSSDVKCKEIPVRRGHRSREKPGPPQEAPVDVGETEVRRAGAPEAQGETQEVRRGEGDAQAMPGETQGDRRAEGTQ